jgi:DGQHR domain-containing protein
MVTENTAIINEVDGTAADAVSRAQEVARNSFREMVPVNVFDQGPRKMVASVLPVRVLSRILNYNAAQKGSTAIKAVDATNRPTNPDHVRTIAEYLKNALVNDEHYILPPLTLNATKGVEVYVPKGMYTGYAVLPEEQAIFITDGQHRFLAMQKVTEELKGTAAGNKFLNDGVPVMITIEEKTSQVHQDFADAGKTKPLPPSLLAVYDVRQRGNRAVLDLIERVKLFQSRIDATSSTLSKNSAYLFLVNQVRQFVKSSLSGSPTLADDAFARQAEALVDNTAFERWLESRATFLNVLTELIPEWKTIADLPEVNGPQGPEVLARMKQIRAEGPVSISSAALTTLGVVSHDVLASIAEIDFSNLTDQLRTRLEPLRKISWDRKAEIWQGNLVDGGKIRTQTPNLKRAHQALMDVLDGGSVS